MLSAILKRYFGQDSLEWFHRIYFVDWLFVGVLWFLSYIIKFWPVFERDFSRKDDSISHPKTSSQIGSTLNFGIAVFVPLVLLVIFGCKTQSLIEIHHGALSLLASRGLAALITNYFKHKIGRLRPDFLARCKWDKAIKACAGEASEIFDGRQSFPSGHSSTAFAGMVFLSLWIAGKTAALCPTKISSVRWMPSRMATFFLTLIPLFWAIHVAVTRVEDYRHHKEDVIVGSLIGTISALVSYLLFWPSPFHSESFNTSVMTEPRYLYVDKHLPRRAYELTAIDDENGIDAV